jgi:hypothetical protein
MAARNATKKVFVCCSKDCSKDCSTKTVAGTPPKRCLFAKRDLVTDKRDLVQETNRKKRPITTQKRPSIGDRTRQKET